MGRIGFVELILMPVFFLIPAAILYFVIKTAIKHAVKELKREGIL